ncbi:MAG: hypothetical protein ND866_28620 [Pyrinomonadaceae bacterium]|nr:hypothetical protein [Pyrinomonadaceae bacterium]
MAIMQVRCVTLVVNYTTAWPRSFDDARIWEDKSEQTDALWQYVFREYTASAFSEPHELIFLVLATVTNYLEDKNTHSCM